VAATFYEVAYQRLREWHNGQAVDLLCFVGETNDAVKRILEECAAAESKAFRAGCVWEVPHANLVEGIAARKPSELDQRIAEALGCQGGRFSAAAGRLLWSDCHEEGYRRQHVKSGLLQESIAKGGRNR
jgi:hypothetical protein